MNWNLTNASSVTTRPNTQRSWMLTFEMSTRWVLSFICSYRPLHMFFKWWNLVCHMYTLMIQNLIGPHSLEFTFSEIPYFLKLWFWGVFLELWIHLLECIYLWIYRMITWKGNSYKYLDKYCLDFLLWCFVCLFSKLSHEATWSTVWSSLIKVRRFQKLRLLWQLQHMPCIFQ